jgi:DNA ligase (NAD+)
VRRESIKHFVSKAGLDIQGIGGHRVEQLIAGGLVHSPPDLFRLSEADLRAMDGMGEKSAANAVNAIAGAKARVTLPRLLCALGIRHVGEQTAKKLARLFPSLDDLAAAPEESLLKTPDVGAEVAASIRLFFREEGNRRLLAELKACGVWPAMSSERLASPGNDAGAPSGRHTLLSLLAVREGNAAAVGSADASGAGGDTAHPLAGKRIAFTGSLTSMPRSRGKELAENAGATVCSGVTRTLDLLVAGDNPGTKLDKAREFGVRIVSEQEFLRLAEN